MSPLPTGVCSPGESGATVSALLRLRVKSQWDRVVPVSEMCAGSPCASPAECSLVSHHSARPSRAGQCQFCEPTGLANPADIFHVNTVGPLIMTFDVSASKQALAFGDSEGCVHLWADSPEVTFNAYSRETDFALPCIVDTLPHLDWNQDLVPLSLIPVPLTNDTLLSDWPAANSAPAPR